MTTTVAPYRYYWTTTTASNTSSDIWLDSTWLNSAYSWPSSLSAVAPAPPRVATAPRGFNRYVNASDLLEEFIGFLGDEGVRQGEVMALPVELFIKWLIIKACEHDGEEPNVTLELPAPTKQPRCLGCQRFLPAGIPVPIHNVHCAGLYFARRDMKKAQRSQR